MLVTKKENRFCVRFSGGECMPLDIIFVVIGLLSEGIVLFLCGTKVVIHFLRLIFLNHYHLIVRVMCANKVSATCLFIIVFGVNK